MKPRKTLHLTDFRYSKSLSSSLQSAAMLSSESLQSSFRKKELNEKEERIGGEEKKRTETETDHLVDDFHGVAEIGGLEAGGEEGVEQARVVETMVEVVALDFGAFSFQAFGFFERRRSGEGQRLVVFHWNCSELLRLRMQGRGRRSRRRRISSSEQADQSDMLKALQHRVEPFFLSLFCLQEHPIIFNCISGECTCKCMCCCFFIKSLLIYSCIIYI